MSKDNNVLNRLNELALKYLENLELSELTPVDFKGDVSVTLIPNNDDAFNLNPITAGQMRNVETNGKNDQGAVARILIGYAFSSRLEANPELFNFQFSMLLNAALSSLTRYLGDLKMRNVTAIRPGPIKTVFTDCENYAGFELRVYVPINKK